MTGIDLSRAQLRHARRNIDAAGVPYRLEHGDAEDLSRFRPASFDLVVSDFAAGFLDLDKLLPQARRVLRPGGRVVLSWASPVLDCLTGGGEAPLLTFVRSYFDRTPFRDEGPDPTWEFARTYGDWIRAFSRAGLRLIDCIEPQASHGQTHTWWPQYKWQRTSKIPGTCIWVAEKPVTRGRARAGRTSRSRDARRDAG